MPAGKTPQSKIALFPAAPWHADGDMISYKSYQPAAIP